MTRILGVIGDPIAHSLSPLIHNAWLDEAGIDARYDPIQVMQGALKSTLDDLANRAAVGVNVTLPHKHDALALAVQASPAAEKIGAANTLTLSDDGNWHADNTDAPGLLRALGMTGIDDTANMQVLVLGAGGSARAAVYALTAAGAKVTILNRTLERAAALNDDVGNEDSVYGSTDVLVEKAASADLVINTTSGGYAGHIHHLPVGDGRLFLDISYGSAAAQQLAHASAQNWQVQDGLGMLVAQAAESFNIWFGQMPETESALTRCRVAVEGVS